MAECLLGNVNDNYKGICVKIINFFIKKGFTPAQALGICANVYAESSYLPTNENPSSKAYGLFQWHPGPDVLRRQKFEKWCNDNGYEKSNPDVQLEYIWYENYRGFRSYYLSHKGMSSHESLIWWQNTIEVCDLNPSDDKDTCNTTEREKELKRLEKLYNDNVKTDDCNVSTGSNDYTDGEDCPPTTVAGSENINESSNSSSSAPTVKSTNGNTQTDTFEPLGKGLVNSRPVLFGGYWAFRMAPYFCKNNEYWVYAQRDQGVTKQLKKDSNSAGVFGTCDKIDAPNSCTLNIINSYLSKSDNKPSHIIVVIDLESNWANQGVKRIKDWRIEEGFYSHTSIEAVLEKELITFFGKINHKKIFVPEIVESNRHSFIYATLKREGDSDLTIKVTHSDLSGALRKVCKRSGGRLTYFTVPTVPHDKIKEPTRVFEESGWEDYSNKVKQRVKNLL